MHNNSGEPSNQRWSDLETKRRLTFECGRVPFRSKPFREDLYRPIVGFCRLCGICFAWFLLGVNILDVQYLNFRPNGYGQTPDIKRVRTICVIVHKVGPIA